MQNRVCNILNIQYPIIQGAMQWVSDASLVATVSNAGGLGVLASASRSKEDIRKEIQAVRKLTDKPFAVNIPLISETKDEIMELVFEEKIEIVCVSAGNPAPYFPAWVEAGIKVVSVVSTVRQAIKMEKLGASVIVAEGQEAGGHIGEMTTMSLVPQIADAISIPLVAAGGIADGRGIAAAFMLGAEGVQIGTAFLAAKECTVHPNYKKAVIESDSGQVVVTGRSVGDAVRCLKNELADGFIKLEKEHAPAEEFGKWGRGSLQKAVFEGDVQMGSVMIGQSVGLVTQEKPVAEIIQQLLQQYNDIRLTLPEIR